MGLHDSERRTYTAKERQVMASHPAKPRIAFLLPGVGVVDRGAEAFVLELTERLRTEFDVTILCRGMANDLCRKVRAIPRDSRYLTIPYQHRIVRRFADKVFLDPIHLESLSFTLNVFPHLLRAKYDMMVSLHGVWGALACRAIRRLRRTPFITVGGALGRPDLWQARQRPDVHVVKTEYARNWIAAKCPNVNIEVIPNGVNLKRHHPDVRPIHLDLERPVYLCAAALVPYKNARLTIEAISQLERGSLALVGRGPLKAELEAQGMAQLGPQRFMLQAVPHHEMPRYYAACDVFTLVSEKECEAFGNVYLEAMACNKPVVATDDPIRTEIVGQAGILCGGYQTEVYARALEQAATTDFGSKPREQAEEFDPDMVAARYAEIIRTCLDSAGKSVGSSHESDPR
jgi:glycosyltransferase involved in cell wall biosynthesis